MKPPKIVIVAKVVLPSHEAAATQHWMVSHGYKLVAHMRHRQETTLEFRVGGPCAGDGKDCLGYAPPSDYLCPNCQ